MRERKDRNLRMDEIIKTSERLFYELGYDNCSIQRIVTELKLSKATFFYFFPTKETVLDEIIRRKCCMIEEMAKAVAIQEGMSREERFIRTLLSVNTAAMVEGIDITEAVHASGNSLMHQKIMIAVINVLTQVLLEIVTEEGPIEGACGKVMLMVTGIKVLLDESYFSWNEQERGEVFNGLIESMVVLFDFDKAKIMQSIKEIGT